MDRQETKDLIRRMQAIFQNRFMLNDPKLIIDEWHTLLAEEDAETINQRLSDYARGNKFPPSVAELTEETYGNRTIPSKEKTKELLQEYENYTPAPEDVREKALEEAARILGVKRRGI